jgi:hypothetical protein
MKWITRERARVDRIACPWLISRFIDPKPEFLFVPTNQVREVAARESAIPYDIPNVELGHHGAQCSFDAFVERYELADPALAGLARIVRGADTDDRGLTPESAGLFAAATGGRDPGAAPGAIRVSPRGGEERHRSGAFPPSRRGSGSRAGRGGGRDRAGRGAGARGGEGARRRRLARHAGPPAPGHALRPGERVAHRQLRLRCRAGEGPAGRPMGGARGQ